MSKITLSNVIDLTNPTTAANTINANSAIIQTAFDNTLSRNGLVPNQMSSSLDMNNNQILNLPTPIVANDPVRLQDVTGNFSITSAAILAAAAAAAASATSASTSATNAATSFNNFNAEYLGPKSSNPVLNNTGGALSSGMLYWNTVSNNLFAYNGSVWVSYAPLQPIRGYISGMTTSNDGVSPNTKINVTAGNATDDTNTLFMTAASGSITCTVTGLNGLDAGALVANSWYHMFVIAKPDGTQGYLASLSLNSPTFPSGYTLKRRIGSFKTNGSSNIIPYVQFGTTFVWAVPTNDYNVSNPGTTAVLPTLTVPTNVQVQAKIWFWVSQSDGVRRAVLITSTNQTDSVPVAGLLSSSAVSPAVASVAQSEYSVLTNTSGQIRFRLDGSGANTNVLINTCGWTDNL